MFDFIKKIFNLSSKKEDSEKFKKLKENLVKLCKDDTADDYYIMWVNKYQCLSDNQYNIIYKANAGFKKTNKIYIEYITYRRCDNKVSAFINNCSNDIYEFIIIDDDIYNALGWDVTVKN